MKVSELEHLCGAVCLTGEYQDREIACGYTCDLLSHVMGRGQADMAWITVQTHMNVIAVAALMDFACVVFPESLPVEAAIVDKARQEDVILLSSGQTAFELAALLAANGRAARPKGMMERLFCDLHIHSCLSPCGDALMTPNNIVGMAFIKGLDVIAVCDHNSARNLPAVKAAADLMNVLLLPGMELTTREEAHMLCYFRTVQACMAFGKEIYAHLAPTPNDERFFGRQQVMNEQDEEIGVEERLLIGALDLPFEACAARIHAAGGLCVPAHINRGSSGVLGALGFLPQGVRYDALEISLSAPPPSVDVTGYRLLHSSDAHHLEQILEPEFTLEARERSVDAVFDAIAGLSI